MLMKLYYSNFQKGTVRDPFIVRSKVGTDNLLLDFLQNLVQQQNGKVFDSVARLIGES